MNPLSRKIIRTCFMWICILTVLPWVGYAQTLDQAMGDAVSQLRVRGLADRDRKEIIIEVVNYHSKKFDREARVIQSALFTALQDQFPKSRILLKEESITGVSANAVLIKATYQPLEDRNIVELKAIVQMNGRMVAKADSAYAVERRKFESLVAVLPLDAPSLDRSVAKTFSKIFRSALTKTGAFNLVSADVIDSADADEIQKQYGCSREECSTIIAEQVNASQVITTQYNKISPGLFFLTASLKDIKSGRTLREEATQHDGNLETLPGKLENLAMKLSGRGGVVQKPIPVRVTGQTGMLVVKSNPTQATILLDGRQLADKTDALLQNLPIGKHQLMVFKGNLGASKTVIVLPDKTEQLQLQLQPLKAEIQARSTPVADLYVDDVRRGTTPIVLNIGVGRHTIEFRKEGFQTDRKSLLVKPFVTNKIAGRLIPLPDVEITSTPAGANVRIDGQLVGTTPLKLKTESGKKTITLALPGYQTYRKEVRIAAYTLNRIKAELQKIVTLRIAVSPPAARVEVNGKFLGGEQELTYESVNDVLELEIQLPAGKHLLTADHPQAEEKIELEVDLDPDRAETTKEIHLSLNPPYLAELKREFDRNRYQGQLSTWKWKWGSAAAGSLLAAFYAQQQYAQAKKAKEEQDTAVAAMLAAPSQESASTYDATAAEQGELIKKYNSNSQMGILVSAGLLGLATWIWLDEPQKPVEVSWMGSPQNKGLTVAWQPFIKHNGQTGLAWQLKW